jgi:hypothetical protein
MFLRSPTLINLAAVAITSMSFFACGSDEANPEQDGSVGGVGAAASGSPGVGGASQGRGGGANGGAPAAQGGTATATGGAGVAQSGAGPLGGRGPIGVGGRGNAGAGNVNCNNANDGATCTVAGAECDRSTSATNPRFCTCSGSPLAWDCVSTSTGNGGRANGGSGGRASTTGGARPGGAATTGGRANNTAGTSSRASGGSSGRGNGGSSGRGNGGSSGRGNGGSGVAGEAVAGAGALPACANGIADGDRCASGDETCETRRGLVCVCDAMTGVAGGRNRSQWSCN